MTGTATRVVVRVLVAAFALAALVLHAKAQTLVEYSAETRFQLDLRVPDAALTAYLPAGWTLDIATLRKCKRCEPARDLH